MIWQKSGIAVAHLLLLIWMIFLLRNGGSMTTGKVILQFMGIAVYGSLLIWGTALWSKRH